MQLKTTIIKFPEVLLKTRDAHKLRGFFGDFFKEKSTLLHNHFEENEFAFRYPLVQYKVIDKTPIIIGIEEGAELLVDLFLKIRLLKIGELVVDINSKNIENRIVEIGLSSDSLFEYGFSTLWMGLNQKNFNIYRKLKEESDKNEFLSKQIQNNILSFYKGVGLRVEGRILAKGSFFEKSTKFKEKQMVAFEGSFVSNAILPNLVGIGKAVSRGFGTIEKI